MLENFRLETTTVEQYLLSVENEEIKVNQAVQRDFCWKSEMMNALIYSTLSPTAIYIPNIILAEQKKDDGIKITYVVDGGQRTETLRRFRYGGYKITKKLRTYKIPYKEKVIDENGKVVRDEDGNIKWELKEFDIRNKTYNSLPEDLKNRFNNYLLAKAVYQDCTPNETSELVLMYNNHLSMNTAQKALTYIGEFAEKVKNIKNNSRFLIDGTALTEREKNTGIWEKVIAECVMAVHHFDSWKRQTDKMDDFLNENSSEEEFDLIEEYFERLKPFSDQLNNLDVASLFLQKNLCVWMMLFDKFTKLNLPDKRFGEFLNAFAKDLRNKKVDGKTWDELEISKQPKDKKTMQGKIDYLETVMMEFLGTDKNDISGSSECVETSNTIKKTNKKSSISSKTGGSKPSTAKDAKKG